MNLQDQITHAELAVANAEQDEKQARFQWEISPWSEGPRFKRYWQEALAKLNKERAALSSLTLRAAQARQHDMEAISGIEHLRAKGRRVLVEPHLNIV